MEKEERDERIKRLQKVEKESWIYIEIISLIADFNEQLKRLEELVKK